MLFSVFFPFLCLIPFSVSGNKADSPSVVEGVCWGLAVISPTAGRYLITDGKIKLLLFALPSSYCVYFLFLIRSFGNPQFLAAANLAPCAL